MSTSAVLTVSEVRFAPASRADSAQGLIGFTSFLLNGSVRVDGVAVRRSLKGQLVLSWPARTDGAGRRHAYLRPITDESRLSLETQVLAALGLGRGSP